ncbi:MAG TPA: endo-1,4-beta-xylanase [Bacteroidota bacterium]|nr:endo-1,4-beta-xylanase [Bacteroidota bacterium]
MKKNLTPLAVFVMVLMSAGSAVAQTALKDVFKGCFLIGAALNEAQFSGRDSEGAALAAAQFNAITPENVLKWELVHPEPNVYAFDAPDRYVAFGEKHNMVIIGHTLVWHHQTPRWVFQDSSGNPIGREALLERMRDHIHTVVGRYKGKIKGWDVVNEALNDDGSLRQTPWLKIIGEDYIVKAYEFAHEADPDAELYYNDYSLENAPKREGALSLIKKLQAAGVHVAAVGLQGHYKMDWPSMEQVSSTIEAFASLGVKVNITELDIDVVPATQRNRGADLSVNSYHEVKEDIYANGLPDSMQVLLATRYSDLFSVFVKHADVIDRVTFWGVTDGNSWLNSPGRVNYPLLFDRNFQPKPAFYAVVKTAM